jgi:hypothetical protein
MNMEHPPTIVSERHPYSLALTAAAQKRGGVAAATTIAIRLLEADHLNDQLTALACLRNQCFVQPERIAVAATSFGGIALGAETGSYCAAVDAASRSKRDSLQGTWALAVRAKNFV